LPPGGAATHDGAAIDNHYLPGGRMSLSNKKKTAAAGDPS
jgi:hypothetical protein